MTGRDLTEAGRAWGRGELASRTYFAMVRRQARARVWGLPRRRWWRRKTPTK